MAQPIGLRLRAMANTADEQRDAADRVVMCADWLVAHVLGERPTPPGATPEDERARLARQCREAMTAYSATCRG